MKKLISLFLALLMLSATAAFAAGTIDLTTYTDKELEALKVQVAEEIRARKNAQQASPASDFIYGSNGMEVRINSYKGTSGDVHIPDEIDGVPVTQIYKLAFEESEIGSIRLPDRLVSIGNSAFYRTENLKSVIEFPKHVQKIGSSAFSFSGVNGVVIQSDCTIDSSCFEHTSNLDFVYIRKDCQIVFDNSRPGCHFWQSSIKTLVLPADVEFKNDSVLEGCNHLTVYCPAGSAAEQYCKDNFIACNTADYEAMVAYYEALYPAD